MIRLVTLRPLEEAPIKGSNAVKGGLGAATKTTSKPITENTNDAKLIASLTGTSASAVEEFITTHNIDSNKLTKFIKKGNLKDRMSFVTALAGNPGNKVQKMIISKFSMNESVNEGRRANDFFSDSKHGKAIHSMLKGKWNGQKVKKYLDNTSTDDRKWSKINDFIANSLGLNLRKYNTYGEQSSAIIDAMEKPYNEFISTNESVTENISVADERHYGKNGIIIMIDDNGKKVSAIFKNKKNADKYNRNNPDDIKKLLDLAKKTKYPATIDESVITEGGMSDIDVIRQESKTLAIFIKDVLKSYPKLKKDKGTIEWLTDLYNNPISDEVVRYNRDLGHYLEERGKIYVDSNFINKSSGILPNSELKHMGFGEFYIDTPKGSVQFARQGNKIEGFVGRVHKMYDDQNGKLVKQLIDGMEKQKQVEPVMPM